MNPFNNNKETFGPKKHKRSKFELWFELLEYCTRTARTQSWLINKLGVKHASIKALIDILLKNKLIEITKTEDNRYDAYLTTSKGEESLKQYYHLISSFFTKK